MNDPARLKVLEAELATHRRGAVLRAGRRRDRALRGGVRGRVPVLLKGPTGCGKTRFVEHMAWRLARPLVTVACHDDLTASDLVGRYLIVGDETVWVDGPLARAVRAGAILLSRRDRRGAQGHHRRHPPARRHPPHACRWKSAASSCAAPDEFMLVISYNPGYQSVLKELKHSTRQRFVAIEFDYPHADLEARIVVTGDRHRPRRRPSAWSSSAG